MEKSNYVSQLSITATKNTQYIQVIRKKGLFSRDNNYNTQDEEYAKWDQEQLSHWQKKRLTENEDRAITQNGGADSKIFKVHLNFTYKCKNPI